eukprot:189916-Hanusia_phi.AAC.4
MGSYKYMLFLPFLYVVCSGTDDEDNWCYHMLVIAALRYAQVRGADREGEGGRERHGEGERGTGGGREADCGRCAVVDLELPVEES